MSEPAMLPLIEEENPQCRSCGSPEIQTAGRRIDAKLQRQFQMYHCKSCGTTWTAGRLPRQQHSQVAIDFCIKKLGQGYRQQEVATMANERFSEDISAGLVNKWAHKAGITIGRGAKRVVEPRALMLAVRKNVATTKLAQDMGRGVSPAIVDQLMNELAFIGKYPKFLQLGWQIRDLRAAAKKINQAVATLESPSGTRRGVETLLKQAQEAVERTRRNLESKAKGEGNVVRTKKRSGD